METIIISVFVGVLVGLMFSQMVNDVRKFFFVFGIGGVILFFFGKLFVHCSPTENGSAFFIVGTIIVAVAIAWMHHMSELFTNKKATNDFQEAISDFQEAVETSEERRQEEMQGKRV